MQGHILSTGGDALISFGLQLAMGNGRVNMSLLTSKHVLDS